jgi:hypothetical protein
MSHQNFCVMHRRCLHTTFVHAQAQRTNNQIRQHFSSTTINSGKLPSESPSKDVSTRHIESPVGSKKRSQPHFDSQKGGHEPASHVKANHKTPSRTPSFAENDRDSTRPNHNNRKGNKVGVVHKPKRVRPPRVKEPTLLPPLQRAPGGAPGEWQPTPPRGMDPLPLQEALQKNGARHSADTTMQAMVDSGEDLDTMAYDELDSIEMSFPPGTLVETRK